MFSKSAPKMAATLSLVAPGAPLRQGLDRVLQARMGALVVVADGPEVLSICTGGFLLDTEYSPQRLYELSKMDGAIILSSDARRIARANVHLMPDPKIPTTETGTRHRTAERVARSLGITTVSVSEEQSIITVYRGDYHHSLAPISALLSKSNQALATLERYRQRLDELLSRLDQLEESGNVHFRDVVMVLQRYEMVRRITEEIDVSLIELGDDGRLVALQLNEMSTGFEFDYRSMVEDYMGACSIDEADTVIEFLGALPTDELLVIEKVAKGLMSIPLCADAWGQALATEGSVTRFDEAPVSVRGMRALSRAQEVPLQVRTAILDNLPAGKVLGNVTYDELCAIPGVSPQWARVVADQYGAG